MTEAQAFVRNAWYMAGNSAEVSAQPLSRRIFGRKIVLWRTADGQVSAIHDRCPHRFAPLSLGERRGDTLVCGYHGLAFDGSGACVHNPFAERIPAAARVDAWAVAERDGLVWLWGGDAAEADPTLIPDFGAVADGPGVRVVQGYTLLEAPYEFGTDNLLDLSHIEFVHKGSFAGAGVIFAGTHEMKDEGAALHSNWWMPRIPAPSHTAGIYPPDMICDHWLDMRWNAPASMYLQVGATPAGQPREGGIISHQYHILTPETETTTHYFWGVARSHELDSAEVDAFMLSLFGQAFDDEDKPMIKAAFDNLDGQDFWDAKPLSLGIDAGGTRARRKIQAMLKAEAAA